MFVAEFNIVPNIRGLRSKKISFCERKREMKTTNNKRKILPFFYIYMSNKTRQNIIIFICGCFLKKKEERERDKK